MYDGVGVAKQSVHPFLLFGRYGREATLRHFLVFLLQCLCYDNLLYAVFAWILVHLLAKHIAFANGRAHLESRIHTNAVCTIQHLGVHTTH